MILLNVEEAIVRDYDEGWIEWSNFLENYCLE